MRIAGIETRQRITIEGRIINNLGYANDTLITGNLNDLRIHTLHIARKKCNSKVHIICITRNLFLPRL